MGNATERRWKLFTPRLQQLLLNLAREHERLVEKDKIGLSTPHVKWVLKVMDEALGTSMYEELYAFSPNTEWKIK